MSDSSAGMESTNFHTPQNEVFYSANLYRPLDPDNNEFRIIEILPAGGVENSLIRCKLIEPPQSVHFSFDCISYVAGDPNDFRPIQVNGWLFRAFTTLGAALRKLRLPDRSRFVWADQICINQSDVGERSSQVQLMRIIYEKADRVHAWLGRLENGELSAQEVLRLESEYNDACRTYLETVGNKRSLTPAEDHSIMEQMAHSLKNRYGDGENEDVVARCSAFGQVFQSEFWERLWIMQEIIVAKAVTLTWDSWSIDVAQFGKYTIILTLLMDLLNRQGGPRPISDNPFVKRLAGGSRVLFTKIVTLMILRARWQQRKNLDFKNLLSNSSGKRCSDPRDRIFGFYGLISDEYIIVTDYQCSIRSVYVSSVLVIIAAERSLDVLAYCQHQRPQDATKNFPTWCPNWSAKPSKSDHRQDLLCDDFSSNECRFQASKEASSQFHVEVSKEENGLPVVSLYTEGIFLGTVDEIGEVPSSGAEMTETSFAQLVKCWSEMVGKQRYLSDDVMQELLKTATVDDRGYPDVTTPRSNIDASNYESCKLDAVKGNRRFIITDSGCMGMAPPHVKVGDLACVLIGARVPFMLRKESEHYTLVGELYLSDGYMTGTAIDRMEAGELEKTTIEIR